jgi:hypothetical protein
MTVSISLALRIAESAAVQMTTSVYRRPITWKDAEHVPAPITLPPIPPRNPRNYEVRA